ncbi:hypothetical protein FBQ97_00060 [Acidobacteria bacterium ACD]|nr:hypothetical protein [Acidobacteria bacterium ACD]
MSCEDCGATRGVKTYLYLETDEPVLLCPACAREMTDAFDDFTDGLVPADEEPETEFPDACFTAADYMRADEGS